MASYLRPRALPEAVAALASGGSGGRPWTLVAGATDHYPARVGRTPDEDVLDLTALAELRGIREVDGGWWLGALVTWAEIGAAPLPSRFDGLRQAARAVGGRQVQERATLAGNVCNASPAADGLPCLIALDAEIELLSAVGRRRMPVATFVTGNRRTLRQPDEIASGFFIPVSDPQREARSSFVKLGSRAYLVISIAMAAAVLELDGRARVRHAAVAVGACSEVAQRLTTLEADLVGRPVDTSIGSAVRPDHVGGLAPIDDVRGTAGYRRDAALSIVRRALEAVAR
jgi:CO/xanthine dehydrogenase FAD-binding subunit